ncbi:Resolvase domain (plasmid) [Methylorubrum extorquens CM4]|uniref:Resolvase domain n=2 Tax=Methylorubrum extorquens TaxID=408 RepID=B7L2V3_METC4|nr:Resolvase domain [Methylorubrum extorquens CM4]
MASTPRGAVLYARGVSGNVERQIDNMLRYCAEHDMPVVGSFTDTGIGWAASDRLGLSSLLAVVASGSVGFVVVEDVDRLSRSYVDLQSIVERICGKGVELHVPERGRVQPETFALVGFLARMQRQEVAQCAQAGRREIVKHGRWPLGAGYGYRKVPGERGSLQIHDAEAEIVRGIYGSAADEDRTPAQIAAHLNERDIPRPRNARAWTGWSVSEMLRRDLHRGLMVYGRYAIGRRPDGRRTKTLLPAERWTVTEVPALRLVDDATWHRAQGRLRHRWAA